MVNSGEGALPDSGGAKPGGGDSVSAITIAIGTSISIEEINVCKKREE